MSYLDNIMRIDFETGCYTSSGELVTGTERPMTILYNKTVITEAEVRKLLGSGKYEYDSRIIVTTPIQAQNLKGK